MAFFGIGKNHPQEIDVPPPSLAPPPVDPLGIAGVLSAGRRVPPTFVYTQRREPNAGPTFTMAPDDSTGALFSELRIAWQEAPDPIRQSDFYAEGNKIHPTAQMRVPSNVAIGSVEAVDEQTFRVGKLLGYMRRPMYAGLQQPSIPRANIQEGIPSTYGSQYTVRGTPSAAAGVAASGFITLPSESNDGYPY